MSAYDPAKHHRRSIRLKGHDYAAGGVYFVTLCAQGRVPLFGSMKNGMPELSEGGRVAEQCWHAIPEHFPEVEACEFVVMPDHMHGIIFMPHRGAKHLSPEQPPERSLKPGERPKGTSRTLGSIVRGYKIGVTKWYRENTHVEKVWQRDYYERIVRDAAAEEQIVRYIRLNPWRCVQHLGKGLRGMGNIALWQAEKLGVLCSRNASERAKNVAAIPGAPVYLSGFHSPMEQKTFKRLLAAKRNVIWCPAWGVSAKNLSPEALTALEENRMLILEMKDSEGNLAAAEARNRFVIQAADRLWTPHVTPGGMLDRLLKDER
ncbi:transposase [Pontiella sp.]|uniref:transposase n=1 Tax=Pontiella sp. TaxID=2837462 RepID=UPI00356AE038